jgi:F-type H+-transporting ATPase subunit delta
LGEIESCYEQLMDSVLKKARVVVKTAFALSDDIKSDLKKKLEEITGKDIEMNIEEDRSLMGGIVVKIGDTLYDGSIKAQLNNIRELLREEK